MQQNKTKITEVRERQLIHDNNNLSDYLILHSTNEMCEKQLPELKAGLEDLRVIRRKGALIRLRAAKFGNICEKPNIFF